MKANRQISVDERAAGMMTSTATVRKHLIEAVIPSYIAKKPYLGKAEFGEKFETSAKILHWTRIDWEKELRTDEAPFESFGHKSRHLVR